MLDSVLYLRFEGLAVNRMGDRWSLMKRARWNVTKTVTVISRARDSSAISTTLPLTRYTGLFAMETRQIRVLHLVKPSQTYILSRSPAPMAIYPITGASADIASRFATVSLKTCIELICDSSSEIFSDSRKDYSVYSLDPLESYGPSSSSSPPGQSVACGRLSAIRSSHNRAMVTGTLMKDKMGQNALELVFVLHEVRS